MIMVEILGLGAQVPELEPNSAISLQYDLGQVTYPHL